MTSSEVILKNEKMDLKTHMGFITLILAFLFGVFLVVIKIPAFIIIPSGFILGMIWAFIFL